VRAGPPVVVETKRLLLRPWGESDANLLVRLSADPIVTRYIGDGHPWTAERAASVANAVLSHWHEHGFGWRPIADRTHAEPIGFVALNYLGEGAAVGLDADELEIGWWLFPDAWHRGYGTEAALAVRDEAFGHLSADSVVARIQRPNTASVAVAEAIKMTFESETIGRFAEPIDIYRGLAVNAR
jgi:RimJ/RimL family protein N-acetyltransferase